MLRDPSPVPVLIGPTASGKTALSLLLAGRLGDAEIVSADSRQVYIGMDIGTAKPDLAERAMVPHHLIDIVAPDRGYTAGQFAADARAAIDNIRSRGKRPLVVGGSGFYIKALFEGLSAPAVDPAVYAMLERRTETEGYEAVYRELLEVDPVAASANSSQNRVKILRALACWVQTGVPYSSYLQNRKAAAIQGAVYQPLYIELAPPREVLYRRIDLRVRDMMDGGLVEETRGLLERGYARTDQGLRTVGYKEIIEYLENGHSFDQMVAAVQQATRRYAKRQTTWFRRIASAVRHETSDPDAGRIVQLINRA